MLQVQLIRQQAEWVKERLSVRNFSKLGLVDHLVEMDEALRKSKAETENLQAAINSASKEIGQLMASGNRDLAESKKQEVASWKSELADKTVHLEAQENHFNSTLLQLPNLPHTSVPFGKSAEDNEVVRQGGNTPDRKSVV